ncbi:MAG: hypothetical protein LAQ69_46125 [Acidobacteriia bacterium]|nr:hypothetical protein [Terriglobia bacterium]
MNRRRFLHLTAAGLSPAAFAGPARSPFVLDPETFRHHVESFNAMGKEEVVNLIPDAKAWEWMKRNVPLFTCPDRDIEQIYYFRWWTWRKHIKQTPHGIIVTEFLKPVKHAAEYNALSCAFGHHVAEGRWLHDPQVIEQDAHFWLRTGENGGLRKNFNQFSGWAAVALYDRWLADGNRDALVAYLDPLMLDYSAWERERLTESGLFWQRDVSDGMESSISGGRNVKNIRPSINSYMYGNAKAIAAIATLAGNQPVAREFRDKAARLKDLVERRLWNQSAAFFETLMESGEFARAREHRVHALVLRSSGRPRRVRSGLEAVDGPAGILRALRAHHRGTPQPGISDSVYRRRLSMERPELAVRHHDYSARAGQRAERVSPERRRPGRLFRDVSDLYQEPAPEAGRRPDGSVDR